MTKSFKIAVSLLLAFALFVCGSVLLGDPFRYEGTRIAGAAPRGALVLDNQSELIYRSTQTYSPEKSSPIDLKGYDLVFEDEFDGDALDLSVWSHVADGSPVRAGVNTSLYTRVNDGNLYLPVKLVDYDYNGQNIRTWAFGDIQLQQVYTYGYFECRAIMPKAHQGLGAFWLTSPYAYVDGVAPEGGVEVDIIESQCYGGSQNGWYGNDPQIYEINIHYNSAANRKKLGAHGISVPGADMYEEFHTYGLLWTPKWYVFYVDGLPVYKTTFGVAGPNSEEQVRLCTELRGSNFKKLDAAYVDNDDTDMIVDYVKIWQLDDPAKYPTFESKQSVNFFNDIINRVFSFFDRVADFFRSLFGRG